MRFSNTVERFVGASKEYPPELIKYFMISRAMPHRPNHLGSHIMSRIIHKIFRLFGCQKMSINSQGLHNRNESKSVFFKIIYVHCTSFMTAFPLYSMPFEMLPISANMYSICGYISVLKFR
jgi:hypothetical protein